MHTDGEQHAHSPEAAGKGEPRYAKLSGGNSAACVSDLRCKSKTYNRTCCTGLLAHVDAGKTTLAEGILYLTGGIRHLGRVDHQDAFFDNFALERERGITIFSKQAQVVLRPGMSAAAGHTAAASREGALKSSASREGIPGVTASCEETRGCFSPRKEEPEDSALHMTLLDTPGHVDFSAEMERTLQVLDYAVLVISGADGVQSHVETLWRLLARYEIPVFLFVNKMDQPGTDRAALLAELTQKLDERCVDFSGPKAIERMSGKAALKDIASRSALSKRNVEDGGEDSDYFTSEEFQEALAMCDEELLEIYALGETIGTEAIRSAIAARKIFPCYFGSALKLWGVQELLDGIRVYSVSKEYPDEFGARVFKITRDAQGNRLTHMKITGGTLRVKDVLTNRRKGESPGSGGKGENSGTDGLSERVGGAVWEEKVNQIRIFSGAGYEAVSEAGAGSICAVTGLDHTYAGEGLGAEPEGELPVLEPVLSYRIELLETPPRCASAAERTRIDRNAAHLAGAPEGTDVHQAFRQLKQLEEEEPQLHITWVSGAGRHMTDGGSALRSDERNSGGRSAGAAAAPQSDNTASGKDSRMGSDTGEIHAQLMGEVQIEILQSMIRDRFGLAVKFGEGSILYRETIAAPVVGMGHFEPLRHYAEVHLLMEPAERGSGLQFDSVCSVDDLALNWQRLILTHLEEKTHLGVLTGSEITDMKITLIAGRAHQKHTEGGDFRQATYRAVRQGLCRAQSVLLEPVYSFRMEVPMESVGRALSDIQRMYGTAEPPELMQSPRGYKGAGGGAAIPGTAGMSDGSSSPGGSISSGSSSSLGAGSPNSAGSADGDWMVIRGTAPVVTMRGYQSELLSYTKGRGRLFCRMSGYEECHNAQEVIETRAYNAEADLENPCGSVFCAHGAGFVVNWEDVPDYVHIAGTDAFAADAEESVQLRSAAGDTASESRREEGAPGRGVLRDARTGAVTIPSASDEELKQIFERTYGESKWDTNRSRYGSGSGTGRAAASDGTVRDFNRKRKPSHGLDAQMEALSAPLRSALNDRPLDDQRPRENSAAERTRIKRNAPHLAGAEECLLVDGYNVIFAWDELKELAKTSLESARGRLLDLMSNYQGYKNNYLIVVFDAYRVEGHATEVSRYHNIYVVFTKEAETADQYIEKTVRLINRKYHVTVATSDALEQVIILGAGASRMSARGLHDEVDLMLKDLRENYMNGVNTTSGGSKAYLLDGREDMREALPED
ncbi:MAG: TetM/TetW/TetO/TetS family tetracycline resistance ribosomal protection protein [Clostridiales bacterium]|nr:TetM/TetW/TetO/TetS family tetracycline resistance ribosomal protection protein [Clostridiales bacterium]